MFWNLALMVGYPLVATGLDLAIRKYVTGEMELPQLEAQLGMSRQQSERTARGLLASEAERSAMEAREFGGMQDALAWGHLMGSNPSAKASRARAASERLSQGESAGGAGPAGTMAEALAQKLGLTSEDLNKLPSAREFSPVRAVLGVV